MRLCSVETHALGHVAETGSLGRIELMSEQQPPNSPLEKFTTAGRLLAIATIVFAGGFFYWNVIFIHDNFPAGRYPIAFIAIPVLIGSAIFYGAGCLIFNLFGIRVRKDSDNDKPAA